MFPAPPTDYSPEFAIYNDGVPSSVFFGEHPEHSVVQHIPDEAIEELFPPNAEDAAEMDAAEDFVETMAWLSYLDDQETAARLHFAGHGKRWAARRRTGLRGKPHAARIRDDDSAGSGRHRSGTITSASDMSALVPYTPRMFEVRPRKVDSRMGGWGVPRNARGVHGHRAIKQQPKPKFVAHKVPTRGKRGRAPAQSNRLGGRHMA